VDRESSPQRLLILELLGTERGSEQPLAGSRTYLRRLEDGTTRRAVLSWDARLHASLAELERTEPDRSRVQHLGDTLRAFLEQVGWEREDAALLEAVRARQPVFLTFRSDAPELYALPWELVTLRGSGLHLGELRGCTVRYEWPGSSSAPPQPAPPPLGGRILFAWSAAGGTVPAEAQLRALQRACQRGGHPFDPRRDVVAHVSPRGLTAALERGGPVAVLHLLCHGARAGAGRPAGLLWNASVEGGEPELIDGGDLRQYLEPHAGRIRLVVLSACLSGGAGPPGDALGSVAQALHRAGLAAVVASRFPLSVEGSVGLTESLYGELLGRPSSLEQALDSARVRLALDPRRLDWASLQLYARAADGADMRPVIFRPYQGLMSFQREHSRFFFGRAPLSQELERRVLAARARQGPAFLMVVGASGSGKSSLVLAGLLPRLPEEEWQIEVVRPGECVAPEPEHGEEGARLSPSEVLQRRMGDIGTVPGRTLLLVVDQFEEVFTHLPKLADQQDFVRSLWRLAGASTPRAVVLVTLRVDYLGHCGELVLDERTRLDTVAYDDIHRLFVRHLEADQLMAAIEGPARAVGLRIDQALVDVLLRDLGQEPGALPLLEYTLDLLWERREGNQLTYRAYEAIGGVSGALARTAERQYEALAEEERRAMRRLLLELVDFRDEASPYTRRRVLIEHARPRDARHARAFDTALAALEGARLVNRTGEEGATPVEGAGPWLQVAHEALIRHWDRLGRWIREDQALLTQLRELQEWAAKWRAHQGERGGGIDYLLTGVRLGYAQRVQEQLADEAPPDLLEFIARSRARVVRQRRRALFRVVALIAAALLVAASMAGLAARALEQKARAESLAVHAKDVQRAIAAQGLQESDPTAALLLLREVERPDGTFGRQWARVAEELLERPVSQTILKGHHGAVLGVSTSPDDRWVATASKDWSARLWRMEGAAPPRVLAGHEGQVNQVLFSPDGETVATASEDGTARLWRVADAKPPRILRGHVGAVLRLAFSPTGKYLATGGADGTVRLWSLEEPGDGRLLPHEHGGPIEALAFSPEGARLAAGAADGVVRLWWTARADPPVLLLGHRGPIRGVGFDPLGRRLVSASADGTARVWWLERRAAPLVLTGHTGPLTTATFSQDGSRLLTASMDYTARLWEATGGRPLRTLQGHLNPILAASFSPDDQLVLTSSVDGAVRIWSSQRDTEPLILRGHRLSVPCAIFSRDSARVITGSLDRTARVWTLGPPLSARRFVRLAGHEGPVWAVAFAPGGRRIATASQDGTARLWTDEGLPLAVFRGHTEPVRAVVFGPDGRWLFTGSNDGTVRRWSTEGTTIGKIVARHDDWIQGVALSPDGTWLATASRDDTARLWPLGGGSPVEFVGHEGGVRSVAFSPDGTRLVTASEDGTARVWRVDGVGAPLILRAHGDWVRSAVFSPKGNQILTASQDGTAQVWWIEGAAPRLAITFPPSPDVAVHSASWSPDGQLILTAGADHVARLWPADDANELLLLAGHTRAITSAIFDPLGRRVLTGSMDGTARLWFLREPLSPGDIQARLRGASTACLSLQERLQYLGESLPEAYDTLRRCEAAAALQQE
jgi:WD40 repeat protein